MGYGVQPEKTALTVMRGLLVSRAENDGCSYPSKPLLDSHCVIHGE